MHPYFAFFILFVATSTITIIGHMIFILGKANDIGIVVESFESAIRHVVNFDTADAGSAVANHIMSHWLNSCVTLGSLALSSILFLGLSVDVCTTIQ